MIDTCHSVILNVHATLYVAHTTIHDIGTHHLVGMHMHVSEQVVVVAILGLPHVLLFYRSGKDRKSVV